MPTEIHCGPAITQALLGHVADLPLSRVLAVVDPKVRTLRGVRLILDQLAAQGALQIEDGPSVEPDFEYLEQLRANALPFDPSLIVGIGGGSTMDAAKGLAIVVNNPAPCDQYQGFELYRHAGRPCLAIPTLLGSGAEMTPSAVFFNRAKRRKGGINGRAVCPAMALIDPLLMEHVPLPVMAATAMDALVHAIESSVARCATPVTRMFAADAVRALAQAMGGLDAADRKPALMLLAEGTFKAILSLMHSEQGLAGGASYPMGVLFGVPHGLAGGRALPQAILMNAAARPGLYDSLAMFAIGWMPGQGRSSANALADKLTGYMDRYGVPHLSRWLAPADLEMLSREIHGLRGIMDQNPVDFTLAEVRRFLEALLANESCCIA